MPQHPLQFLSLSSTSSSFSRFAFQPRQALSAVVPCYATEQGFVMRRLVVVELALGVIGSYLREKNDPRN